MNRVIKLRLMALGFAVAVMGVLIVLVTLNSERQAAETSARLGEVDTESFRIADRFRDKLRYTNDRMRNYATAREPMMWQEFLASTDDLHGWIRAQELQLTADPEKAVLKQIEGAFS